MGKTDKWELMMQCAKELEQPFSSEAVMDRIIAKHHDRQYSVFQVRRCLSTLVKLGELEYAGLGYDNAKKSTFTQYRLRTGGTNGTNEGQREYVRVGDAHLVGASR